MKILVSACLLGTNCKYNGGNNFSTEIHDFLKGHEIFSVCPEVLGGLSIPRSPAENVNGEIKTKTGESVDYEYRLGAQKCFEIAQKEGIELAILQSRSPSCGVGVIYDGTFSKTLISGDGVFAQMLIEAGIKVIDSKDIISGKITPCNLKKYMYN